MSHISPANIKTGAYSFDLPAVKTCPGKTEFCVSKCYALRLEKIYRHVANKYENNLEFTKCNEFVIRLVEEIPRRCDFRIHVSGDFYSAAYVRKWIQIATKRKDVQFYCYTRSWRIPKIMRELRKLNRLPNVTVNLSVDPETGKPKIKTVGFRLAYLTYTDKDNPSWLSNKDIVFRVKHSKKLGHHQWYRARAVANGLNPNIVAPLVHRIGAAPVCPLERGAELKLTCNLCRICIKK